MSTGKQNWIVITSGSRPIGEISTDLGKEGLKVNSVLDAIGQIIAETDGALPQKARAIPGVADIVPMAGDIQLPEPGSELTW